MGVFSKFADTPLQIKREGQEITLKFTRTGPTTGRISWNIPMPAVGCEVGTQAYDGIVITVADKAANYLSTSPQDGTFYTGDPTVDANLFSADLIDNARVLAAFYNDKTTTFLDVTDVADRTIYYISGYAVDTVCRYHREGVHAYSLPTGSEEGGTPDKSATHNVMIDVIGGITLATSTGLIPDTVYPFRILLNSKEYTINIDGEDALTYSDLVFEFNKQLSMLGDVFTSPLAPHTNELYYKASDETLFVWDGTQAVLTPVLTNTADPTTNIMNALWYVPDTAILKQWNGSAWIAKTYISTPFNPSTPSCNQTWFDGTHVWQYKLTHWEQLTTYITNRNPLMAPSLSCDDYWYDKTDLTLNVWDVTQKHWTPVNAIYFDTNPNSLSDGAYWYDETALIVKIRASSAWNTLSGVFYIDDVLNDGSFGDYGTNNYVFVRNSLKLYKYNTSTHLWDQQDVLSFPVDPTDRTLSKLWWNSTIGIDNLFYWDLISSTWVAVTAFVQSEIDPSLPVPVANNSAWYNPDTGDVKLIFDTSCVATFPIKYSQNPLSLSSGTIWFNSDTNLWYSWNGSAFLAVEPLYYPTSPYSVVSGYYWFDENASLLKKWTGVAWATQTYVTKPTKIPLMTYWFNSSIDTLYVWNGTAWIVSLGVVSCELIQPPDSTGRTTLSFFTREVGCAASLQLVIDPTYLLSKLLQPLIYCDPVVGPSGLTGGAMQQQLGVGDDGSPDERRLLQSDIRSLLGSSSTQIELTKEQLDLCINNALQELRKHSSFSYKRGFFFIDLMPNQQTYILSNRCVGFNTIVNIRALYRMRGSILKSTAFGNDVFAFSAMQQLYSGIGTFDILSFHLIAGYMKELETLFAERIMFNWMERKRELRIHQVIGAKQRVLVDGYVERPEQELITDRNTAPWLRKWATAEAKKILSQVRGKFVTLPGPNGSTTLNASDLQTQAENEMTDLRTQLYDMGEMQDLQDVGAQAHVFIG